VSGRRVQFGRAFFIVFKRPNPVAAPPSEALRRAEDVCAGAPDSLLVHIPSADRGRSTAFRAPFFGVLRRLFPAGRTPPPVSGPPAVFSHAFFCAAPYLLISG